MRKIIVFIIILLFTSVSSGQIKRVKKQDLIQEKIVLQTNSDFYLAGETIYFKSLCINAANNFISDFSKIVTIEIINKKNVSITKQKLYLKNGICSNDIFIPTNIESGFYKIVAYTNWMLNYDSFYEKDLLIFNPYANFPNDLKDTTTKSNTILLNKNKTNLNQINFNKLSFSKREKVTIKPLIEIKGNFVLNVKRIDSIPFTNNKNVFNDLDPTNLLKKIDPENIKFPAENRGIHYTGKIESKSNDLSLDNKKIVLNQVGEFFDFKITSTDEKGAFSFIVNKSINEEGYLQVYDEARNNYKISLDKFTITNAIRFNAFSNVKLNNSYGKYILNRSIANQIQNIYYHTKSDTTFAIQKNKPFYHGDDIEYVITDYHPQNSLKEVFIEVIPEVYTYKKNGKHIIGINDYDVTKKEMFENTIVLIDGFLLQDIEEILTFDPEYFHKINVLNKGFLSNKYVFNGVVNLITKQQNYIPKISEEWIIKTKLEKPELEKKYFKIDYSKNNYSTIPDYRYQLAWEPTITELNPTQELSFYTSDIIGNYKVSIEGISENGNPILIEDYIEVK